MIQFKIEYDNIRQGKFPFESLEKFPSIKAEKTKSIGPFQDEITISIETEAFKDPNDLNEIYSTIFSLGKLIGQAVMIQNN